MQDYLAILKNKVIPIAVFHICAQNNINPSWTRGVYRTPSNFFFFDNISVNF